MIKNVRIRDAALWPVVHCNILFYILDHPVEMARTLHNYVHLSATHKSLLTMHRKPLMALSRHRSSWASTCYSI